MSDKEIFNRLVFGGIMIKTRRVVCFLTHAVYASRLRRWYLTTPGPLLSGAAIMSVRLRSSAPVLRRRQCTDWPAEH